MNDLALLRKQLESFRQANQVEIFITAEDGETRIPMQIRKIGIEDLMFFGKIPDALSGMVQKMLGGAGAAFDLNDLNIGEMGELFNAVMLACTQWPPLAAEGDDEHFGLDEIPFKVKEAVFSWVNGEAIALEPFRKKPGGDGPSSLSGEDIRPSAE